MRVALVGAELEENLGIRYMASALEHNGRQIEIPSHHALSFLKKEIGRMGNYMKDDSSLCSVTNLQHDFLRTPPDLMKILKGFSCSTSYKVSKKE